MIEIIYNSRLGNQSVRTLAPQAENRKFHFWFSTTSNMLEPNTPKRKNFTELENKVGELQALSNGLLETHFNPDHFKVLKI